VTGHYKSNFIDGLHCDRTL